MNYNFTGEGLVALVSNQILTKDEAKNLLFFLLKIMPVEPKAPDAVPDSTANIPEVEAVAELEKEVLEPIEEQPA